MDETLLSNQDKEALRKCGVVEPRVVDYQVASRVIRGLATDEITEIEGLWHFGEAAADIRWKHV